MSFAAHKELGFESVLIVEGPTEVKTFQQMLRKFRTEHRVVILPVSGRFDGDMAEELEEVMRISSNVHAIIDSEKSVATERLSNKRQEFVALCEKLGLQCFVLSKRATENYFPDDVIKSVFGEQHRALEPFERLKDAPKPWPKRQNWLLARAMSQEQIEATDLGQFLKRLATPQGQ